MKFSALLRMMLLFLLFQVYAPGTAFVAPAHASPAEDYFTLKSRGNYTEALKALRTRSSLVKEPAAIETSIFRIIELAEFPELYDPALAALKAVEENAAQNPFIADRIEGARALIYLKKGDLHAAENVLAGLGYLSFHAMGPFKNSSVEEFNLTYPPETLYDPGQQCQGRVYGVYWFPVEPDRTGIINFNDLLPDTKDAFFYLDRGVYINRPGEYYLILGKTGYTDLWLDGTRIFSDRSEHGFSHDQYFIRVSLPQGPHRLLVKAGDSSEGIRLSLRIAAVDGARVIPVYRDEAIIPAPGTLRGITYFPSLAALVASRDPGPDILFETGYLFLAARLGNDDNPRALRYLSAISETHTRYAAACYYSALSRDNPDARGLLLNRSLRADPQGIEALYQLALLKVSHNFLLEAFQFIRRIRETDPGSCLYADAMGRLCLKRGWEQEAVKYAGELKKSAYPSLGFRLEALVHRSANDYYLEMQALVRLMQLNSFDRADYEEAASCFEKSGSLDGAEEILVRAAALFPNSIGLKLRLASLVEKRRGPGASLPFISAALKTAPGNRDALRALGIAYHGMDRDDLALYWLTRAANYDPDNYSLTQYLRLISGKEDELEQYAVKQDAVSLAAGSEKFRDEPAVIILDETVIGVNIDGSFEKRVRKIVSVNARSEIPKFNNQYIVLTPGEESIERISCVLVRGLASYEITERYRKSLSDPESRLYYDREAVVIPVASLVPGDIIDLHYVIKNRGGGAYRQYFGEKVTIGGRYHTLASRTVLIHPAGKPVYCSLKGVDQARLSVEKSRQRNVYRVTINDIEPYKKESAMPAPSQVLPAVYFTSLRSWDEFHAWYRSFLVNRVRVDEEMKRTVKKIVGEGTTPIERVRRIYSFVTGEIRYVGFEFGVGGIQPRATDTTYHSKMGDCKDMSLLLAALLREAGIDARLALLRTRDRGAAHLPVPYAGEFNHAICYVNLAKGFFIDPTAANTGIREIPADDRGVESFVLDKNGWKFINTESGFYYDNLVEVRSAVTLSSLGDADIRRTLMKQGEAAPAARESLKDPARNARDLNEYWNSSYPGSSVRGLAAASAGVDEPVRYGYDVSVPGFARVQDGTLIFDAFMTKSNFYSSYALSRTRLFPVVLSGAWKTKSTILYAIPAGYRAGRVPVSERYDGGDFSASFTYSAASGAVTVSSVIEMKRGTIGIMEYQQFREFTRFIEKKERERIVLEK